MSEEILEFTYRAPEKTFKIGDTVEVIGGFPGEVIGISPSKDWPDQRARYVVRYTWHDLSRDDYIAAHRMKLRKSDGTS